MNITELLSCIAKQPALPAPRTERPGVEQPGREPQAFVDPEFEEADVTQFQHAGRDALDVPVPQVLLISAPAAVGKSWLARAMSARSGNPLWDLSRFRLGSHFFTGTLTQVYGGLGYAKFEELLREGTTTLILDAADEAVVGSGLSNFEAAIADLAELVTGGMRRRAASVVILGRPDTLELVGVLLEERGLSWGLLTVDYFDEEQAKRFVLTKIEAARGDSVRTEEATDFLTDFFDTVKQALRDQGVQHKEFLGYAPVLDSIASFYASHPNPFATFQSLKRDSNKRHVWTLLHDVVRSICARETEKFAAVHEDEELQKAARVVYSIDEQIRLLTASEPSGATIAIPETLGDSSARQLLESWRAQFEEHPFFRRQADRVNVSNPFLRFSSVMFRDFLASEALVSSSDLSAAIMVADLMDDDYVPSPILARFVASRLAGGAQIGIQALPAVLESVASDLTEHPLSVTLEEGLEDEDEESSEVAASSILLSFFEAGVAIVTSKCRDDGIGPVTLGRSVGRAVIDLPHRDVEVPADRVDLLFSGSVDLICETLRIDASDVRVQVPEGQFVTLTSSSFASRSLRVFCGASSAVRVVAPEARHPWFKFLWSDSQERYDDDFQVYQSALRFRQLFRWFSRPSIAGRLTYPAAALDTIVAKGRADWEAFQYLESKGYIERRASSYHLGEPVPALVVLNLDLSDEDYLAFLRRFLRWQGGPSLGN